MEVVVFLLSLNKGDAILGIIREDVDSLFANPEISEYANHFSLVSSDNWFDFEKSVSTVNSYIQTTENKIKAEQLKKNIADWNHLKKDSPALDFKYPDIVFMAVLIDKEGKLVYKSTIPLFQKFTPVDLCKLETGTYLVMLNLLNGKIYQELIVIK